MKKTINTTNLKEINKLVSALGWNPGEVTIEVKTYEDVTEPDVIKTRLVLVK